MYYTLKPQGDIILSSLKWFFVKYPLTAMRKVTDAQQNTQRQEPGDKGVGTQQAVSRQHQLTSTKGHGISKLSPIPGVREVSWPPAGLYKRQSDSHDNRSSRRGCKLERPQLGLEASQPFDRLGPFHAASKQDVFLSPNTNQVALVMVPQ